MAANPERDRLAEYRGKRDPERTPEPFGHTQGRIEAPSGALRFVVQKHAARRPHYDLRLELGAVLKWPADGPLTGTFHSLYSFRGGPAARKSRTGKLYKL